MGWSYATPLVRALTVVVFVGMTAAYGFAAYKPANPQWALLIFAAFGIGAITALGTLKIGNFITHPLSQEITRAAFDRRTYANGNSVPLIQVALLVAIGVMGLANLIAVLKFDGGWLAGASCATFFAIAFYPAVRHRIERGRWPDQY